MALFLTERDVERLLTMPVAMEAVEDAFLQQGSGAAVNAPRQRVRVPGHTLQVMPAALPHLGVSGVKTYATSHTRARFVFLLFSLTDGELLAIMEADKLGQMRTGAASGVAAKYMAREDSATVGIFGTGWQARTQLQAVCSVRAIRQVAAYSRSEERRRQFAAEMSGLLGIDVAPAETSEEAVRDKDIVVTITTASKPVFDGRGLEEGTHINAAGSNVSIKREIDDEAVSRCVRIIVDSREQAQIECGDLLTPIQKGILHWGRVHDLGEVVSGRFPGRESDSEITLFESQGIAIEDVAVAYRVYTQATTDGIGQEIPTFL